MQMFGRKPAVVWHDQNLGDTLRMFCEERAHMAIVRDVQYSGNVSVVDPKHCILR